MTGLIYKKKDRGVAGSWEAGDEVEIKDSLQAATDWLDLKPGRHDEFGVIEVPYTRAQAMAIGFLAPDMSRWRNSGLPGSIIKNKRAYLAQKKVKSKTREPYRRMARKVVDGVIVHKREL